MSRFQLRTFVVGSRHKAKVAACALFFTATVERVTSLSADESLSVSCAAAGAGQISAAASGSAAISARESAGSCRRRELGWGMRAPSG
ncbi:hypothetical protein [Methylomonas sp. ZR1]|uniref:hypothetical protein n=1 Tax=Methylomonas sp. ZR1 TaxID=1797072 RepID=UPI00149092ED|nr:hypothetical protein [Methylomonas sp. ZR1]